MPPQPRRLPAQPMSPVQLRRPPRPAMPAPARSRAAGSIAYGQFEAFVLQSFVQSMLPKNATNVFGKGSAGEFWKSMLAEKMGDELARSGQVGIARRLAAGPSHPVQPGIDRHGKPDCRFRRRMAEHIGSRTTRPILTVCRTSSMPGRSPHRA